jgi:hypothetical protein
VVGEVDSTAVAQGIADQVRNEAGRRGGWFEVRTLMSKFEIDRYSDEAKARMNAALTGAGLEVDPPLETLDRRDTVVLTAPASPDATPDERPSCPLAEVVTARFAAPGDRLRQVALDDLPSHPRGGGVRWFDVANSAEVSAVDLLKLLEPFCAGQLTRDMVDDLLSPDPRPQIKRHGETGDVRCVAAFAAKACESDEGAEPASCSKAGVLEFQPVEFLVGNGWVVTCWHDVEVYRAAKRIRESEPKPSPALFDEVERCWPANGLSSAGDLAVLILLELSLSYAAAYRQFYAWLEEWELDFYRRDDRVDTDTLLEVRASAAVLKDWLSPLNPPGMRQDVAKAWFPDITGTIEEGGYHKAIHVDDRIDKALKGLTDLAQEMRSAYDLLQLRLGERERERDDKFQRNIAVGGSVILFPTLVAGVMGANTWVPGQWKEPGAPPHWAFLALIGILVLSGFVAWGAIHWLQRRDERT